MPTPRLHPARCREAFEGAVAFGSLEQKRLASDRLAVACAKAHKVEMPMPRLHAARRREAFEGRPSPSEG